MAQPKTLNATQVGVLRWIANGCPDSDLDQVSARISAGALARRGLVTTTGRGPTWTATITPAGTEYLAQVDGPNPPRPRQANISVTEQLVADVIAAGGTLRVSHKQWGPRAAGEIDYEQRARTAQRRGKTPPGTWFELEHLDSGTELQIKLMQPPPGTRPTQAIPVPETISELRPIVVRFRDDTDRHEISRAALPRAVRIINALVTEAERRGYSASIPSSRRDQYGRDEWTSARDGHLAIAIRGTSNAIRIDEEGMTSRAYWHSRHYEPRYRNLTPEQQIAAYETDATGRLHLEILPSYRPIRTTSWADRKDTTLEETLHEVLYELEIRAHKADQKRATAEREAEQRQRVWEDAKHLARERFLEHRRIQVLDTQLQAWHRTHEIRAYCDAIEATYPDDPETRAWIAWARNHADSLDPLATPPREPDPPEPISRQDLEPFLDGWDPDEPIRTRRGPVVAERPRDDWSTVGSTRSWPYEPWYMR